MNAERTGRVLVVDDEESMLYVLRESLERAGHDVLAEETATGAVRAAAEAEPEVVVLDIRLPDGSGLDALDRIQTLDPDLPVVMITGDGSRELGLEAVSRGAYDFFTKPIQPDELRVVVERALEKRHLVRQLEAYRSRDLEEGSYGRIVGRSPAMRRLFRSLDQVVDTEVSVLIQGETGTGKELVAEEIHRRGPRSDGPLVKLNCIAIPEGLVESELFGHEKGAFTGADEQKPGKFELADGGTLFLDEIGDLAREVQGKLLRVLQEQTFERVGGTESIETDVRLIAATNKELRREMEEGGFREDLFYRLNVYTLRIPPLRERKADLPYLIQALLERIARQDGVEAGGVTSGALSLMLRYDWPGNVRELENALRSAAVRAGGRRIRARDLPEEIRGSAGSEAELAEDADLPPGIGDEAGAGEGDGDVSGETDAEDGDVSSGTSGPAGDGPGDAPARDATSPTGGDSLDEVLEAVEESLIRQTLDEVGGVQARAAERLGVSERSLWYRVKKYGIDPDRYRPDAERGGDPGDPDGA